MTWPSRSPFSLSRPKWSAGFPNNFIWVPQTFPIICGQVKYYQDIIPARSSISLLLFNISLAAVGFMIAFSRDFNLSLLSWLFWLDFADPPFEPLVFTVACAGAAFLRGWYSNNFTFRSNTSNNCINLKKRWSRWGEFV